MSNHFTYNLYINLRDFEMKLSEIELPSNRKFGFFFTLLFAATATYFFNFVNMEWAYVFILLSLIFLVITLVKQDILLPMNKLWFRFGLLLGMIVSPIVLGMIFFGIFTPTATLMRLCGRDELKLKFKNKLSHWVIRRESIKSESFKNQF